jgi:tRNA (cytidine/uridine-2'-O-)-methyltransferase
MRDPFFHVVLHEPEIPNNTGNIGRTCVATRCALHLIHPLGFDTSEKACRRAGLDYWPRLGVQHHDSFAAFRAALPTPRLWLFSAKASTPFFSARFQKGDLLLFGKETAGLPDDLLAQHADAALLLPIASEERGLNLATAVCAVVYEGLRQLHARGELPLDSAGRLPPRPF